MRLADLTPAVPVALVGAGAAGGALARRLHHRGHVPAALLSRRRASAEAVGVPLGIPVCSDRLADLPADVRVVFCGVPDAALPDVATALAALDHPWGGTVVAHLSGALPADVLAPLAYRGATILSFHPMQTFAADAPHTVFDGIGVGVEGQAEAVAWGCRCAEYLGTTPVPLSPDAKTRYHLAAVVASNFFVTLMGMAREILGQAGLPADTQALLLRPLVDGTWRNLAEHLPEDALTGPVARADAPTLQRHLDDLAEHLPHLVPAYAALSIEAVRLAIRGGHLSGRDAQHLLDLLYSAVTTERLG
ncbi:MAG: Rossmann-like and DUF2520 domain-containing protein [Bacteroidota bacterium]